MTHRDGSPVHLITDTRPLLRLLTQHMPDLVKEVLRVAPLCTCAAHIGTRVRTPVPAAPSSLLQSPLHDLPCTSSALFVSLGSMLRNCVFVLRPVRLT